MVMIRGLASVKGMDDGETDEAEPARAGDHVLVVDDDAEIRLCLQDVLQSEGYRVSVLSEGERALRYLAERPPPQLILLDLSMPTMSGFEVLERIKADERLVDVPVVVFTAMRASDADAVPRTATACLSKPVSLDALLDLVERYCA